MFSKWKIPRNDTYRDVKNRHLGSKTFKTALDSLYLQSSIVINLIWFEKIILNLKIDTWKKSTLFLWINCIRKFFNFWSEGIFFYWKYFLITLMSVTSWCVKLSSKVSLPNFSLIVISKVVFFITLWYLLEQSLITKVFKNK